MTYSRDAIINATKPYIGCVQGDAREKELLSIYNNATGAKWTTSTPWCCISASDWAIICEYGTDFLPRTASCGDMIKKATMLGIWEENDAYIPKRGDYIIYDWSDTGKGDDREGHDHIGVVIASDGKKNFTVREGNMGDRHICGDRLMQVNGKYIRGFVTPRYTEGREYDAPDIKPIEYYVVKKRDTLSKIAAMYGCTVDDILLLNPQITNPNLIRVGQKITIPTNVKTVTYTVKKGDTLSKIANRYGLYYKAIAELNGIKPPYTIYPGQTIILSR